MIKKSLSIALLSVSVLALGACSSNDDDDTAAAADAGVVDAGVVDAGLVDAGVVDAGLVDAGVVDAGVVDAGVVDAGLVDAGVVDAGVVDAGAVDAGDGGAVDGGAVDGGETDGDGNPAGLTPGGYLPGTLTALVEENGGLAALQALQAVNLDLSLNDPNNAWTVILPTDAALAAFEGTVDLQSHIVTTGAFSSEDVTGLVGSNITVNSGAMIAIGGGGTEPLTIGGNAVVTPDLSVEGGQTIVHLIDGVIVAP